MRRTEPILEPRLRELEITAAARSNLIETNKSDLRRLERDQKDFEARIQAIEKTLVRLALPMRAATWAAAVFTTSIIALIWSLILGKAQIIFP